MQRRRLVFSILSGLLLEVLNKISPLLILYHAQKYLGLRAFGGAQFGLAWLDIISPLVAFGYTSYAVAAISRSEDASSLYARITSLKSLQALLVLLAVALASPWQSRLHPLGEHFALLALVLLANVVDASWWALARQKLTYVSLIGGGARVLSLLAILLWVRAPTDRDLFMFLQLVPGFLMAGVTGYFAHRRLGFTRPDFASLGRIFRAALPFAAIMLLLVIYDRYDLFLLERWFGLEAAGAYAGPAKVVQSLAALGTSVVAAFSAELVQVKATDRESLRHHTAFSLWCMLAIATPIIFGAPFVESDAMRLLFTHEDPAARGLFSWLCLGILGQVFITVFGVQILQLKGEPWTFIACLLPGLCLGPWFAWLARDAYGWPVMAWAVLCSKGTAAVLVMLAARRVLGQLPWSPILRTLAAGACMALVLYGIVLPGILLNLLVGGAVYFLCLALLNRQKVLWVIRHPKLHRYWRGTL